MTLGECAIEAGPQGRSPWTQAELVAHLRDGCGVSAGDTLIVHSSADAVGPVENGVMTIVKALKAAVTEAGTLLLPVFSSPPKDGIFKVRRTPSRVGLITEAFRRSPDVLRSLHPTHSVAAWGRRRDEFLAGHESTSGLGVDSPFHKAAKAGATVLMIGCNMTTLSLIHVAEAIVRVPYLGKVCYPGYDRPFTLVDYHGLERVVPPVDVPTDSVAFIKVQHEMERRGQVDRAVVGAAETLRFDAAACLDLTVEMLRVEPTLLLCTKPRCSVCPGAWKICQEAAARP